MDFNLRLPLRKEMGHIYIRVGDHFYPGLEEEYSYYLVMGGRSLYLASPSNAFIYAVI